MAEIHRRDGAPAADARGLYAVLILIVILILAAVLYFSGAFDPRSAPAGGDPSVGAPAGGERDSL